MSSDAHVVLTVGSTGLVPAEQLDSDPRGLVHIWEMPRASARYVLGADTSVGITAWDRLLRTQEDNKIDNAVIEVLRCGSPDVQVAEYAAPIDHYELATVVNFLGRMYAGNAEDGQALACIEMNNGGWATHNELVNRYGYIAMPPWRMSGSGLTERITDRYGWYSNRSTRKDLWIKGMRHINARGLTINSPWLVEEMTDCTWDNFLAMTARGIYGCFVPGTTVLTSDGTSVPIEGIKVRYSIVTHAGGSGRVQRVIPQPFKGNLVALKVSGLPAEIRTTPNHLFWAKKRRLTYLQSYAVRKHFPSEWVAAKDLQKGDWLAVPKRQGLKATNLSCEQLYAIGFWLAEGNYIYDAKGNPRGIELTNTNRKLIEQVASTFRKWFPQQRYRGNQFSKQDKHRPTREWWGERQRRAQDKLCHKWLFQSRYAGEFFYEGFGHGCATKRVSATLYKHSNLLPLVSGFLDGDGSQRQNQQHDVNLYTTSPTLAWQMRQIMLDSGVWSTIRQATQRAGLQPSYVLNVKANYLDKFTSVRARHYAHRIRRLTQEDEGYFYTPIRSITREPYDGQVYDLTVSKDHTYTAGGVAVHNSHDDRVVASLIAIWYAHEWDIDLNPLEQDSPERTDLPDYQRSAMSIEDMNEDWEAKFSHLLGDD